jgi:D-alanine-D-alanine ligase
MLTDSERAFLAEIALVVVTDGIVLAPGEAGWLDRRLDRSEQRHVDEMRDAIGPLLKDFVVYHSPEAFIDNIARHSGDIVLPDWSGERSWNRYGLVPAVCEAYGVTYIGGDAYTKIVCQDKFLSKSLCRRAGLEVPDALYIDEPSKLEMLDLIGYPSVVKPCFEGTSIGISDHSIVHSASDARYAAGALLEALGAPVLVERFCPGREVSICLVGNARGMALMEAGERFLPSDERYFETHLFSAALKKNSKQTALRLVTNSVPKYAFDRSVALFRSLQKVELIRVDGRLNRDCFTVIELTPETHLGARAEFAGTFIKTGLDYQEVLARLILNSRGATKDQPAKTRT